MAFVVPAFDLDSGLDFPLSKAVLADAVAASKAEHLDKLSCPHCHKFAGKNDCKTDCNLEYTGLGMWSWT